MKAFYDLVPLLIFFGAYLWQGIYWATGLAIAAAGVQLTAGYLIRRRVERVQAINFVLIAGLGGLTLLLRDASFIKWKPTLVNWLFGAIFLASLPFSRRPLLERLLGTQLQLATPIWRRLTLVWGLFFLFCGALNLYVAFGLSVTEQDLNAAQRAEMQQVLVDDAAFARSVLDKNPGATGTLANAGRIPQAIEARQRAYLEAVALDNWVKFKVFGLLAITLIFVLLQSLYLAWLTRGGSVEATQPLP